VCPAYGRRAPAPALAYSTVTSLPLRIITLLLPAVDSHAEAPVVTSVVGMARVPVGLVFGDGTGVHLSASGVAVLGPRKGGESKDVARTLSLRT
jgi:hypothetical protein